MATLRTHIYMHDPLFFSEIWIGVEKRSFCYMLGITV